MDNLDVDVLPREWNGVVGTLANHGGNNHASKLYFKGMDHSFWLMKSLEKQVGYTKKFVWCGFALKLFVVFCCYNCVPFLIDFFSFK